MEAKDGGGGWRGWRGGWGAVRRDEGGGMLAGRMRVSVKSEGSCSEGSESLSESSSIRACWDIWFGVGWEGGWRLEVGGWGDGCGDGFGELASETTINCKVE